MDEYVRKQIEEAETKWTMRTAKYARRFRNAMFVWTLANVMSMGIGIIGYLVYAPIQIDPSTVFRFILIGSSISMVVQGFAYVFGHPWWMG